jgi:tetratricopeptide (TPR) repeat protein
VARKSLICLLLVAATLAVYGQTAHFDFVHFDDDRYVTDNPHVRNGLTRASVTWALTAAGPPLHTYWQPVTWLSLMLDTEISGDDAGGFHVSNVLLHVLNTLLLFAALQAMTGANERSALVAGLFALHPLHVEPVAWIAERKELLSTAFGLLAMWAYVVYAKRGSILFYAGAALFLALGLMAKAMIVTLPLLFLLLDYWPLERFRARGASESAAGDAAISGPPRSAAGLALEKIPLLAVCAASSAVTFAVQSRGFDVHPPPVELSLGLRVANALVSYVRYLGKTLWPGELSPFYPHPNMPELGGTPWADWQIFGAAALLLAISAALIATRRRYAIAGWLWYLGMLAPVIGLVQFAPIAIADRYTYVPLTGIFLALVWGGAEAVESLPGRRGLLRGAGGLVAVGVLGIFAAASWQQVRHWRDSTALFEHALELNPRSSLMQMNLGIELFERGEVDLAIERHRRALEIHPRFAEAHLNLGNAFAAKGRADEAMAEWRQALQITPYLVRAHYNLGNMLMLRGETGPAIAHFRRAVRIDPDYPELQRNLAHALANVGELEEAIQHYRSALRLQPGSHAAHANLGRALELNGDRDAALRHYREALRIDPGDREARQHLDRLTR